MGLFNRDSKRVTRVLVNFIHGSNGEQLPPHEILLSHEQKFVKDIGSDYVIENGVIVERFTWRAGFTVIYTYYYK